MLNPNKLENTVNVPTLISSKMANAIDLWDAMYRGESPWLHKGNLHDPVNIESLGLPSMIASEKARMAVLEMKSTITAPTKDIQETNPDYVPAGVDKKTGIPFKAKGKPTINKTVPDGPTERAEWLDKVYQDKVVRPLRTQLEYAEAKGGMIIKPYIVFKDITNEESGEIETQVPDVEIEFIQADGFFPLSFDGSNKITDAVFVQTKIDSDVVYRRLERHTLVGTKINISNKAFKAKNTDTSLNQENNNLGDEIPLSSVPEWKDLQPTAHINNVDRLLFAYYKEPTPNVIDLLSPIGCSCFARAIPLIEQADRQYSRILWEYEATEAAIDIDRDALNFMQDSKGNNYTRQSVLQQRLYRKIDLGESETYKPFLPTIRDSSLFNGLNQILMKIEDVCAISRGTLSDVASSEARTATELKILKQRSFSSNQDIQHSLEKTLKDVVYILNVYCSLYNLAGDVKNKKDEVTGEDTQTVDLANIGAYEVSFEWDDSILVDAKEELETRIRLFDEGLMSKVELRMWYFGETEEQAKAAIDKIDGENQEYDQDAEDSEFEGTDNEDESEDDEYEEDDDEKEESEE